MSTSEAAFRWVQAPVVWGTPYGCLSSDDSEGWRLAMAEMALDLEYGPPLEAEEGFIEHVRSFRKFLDAMEARLEAAYHEGPMIITNFRRNGE